MLAANLVVVVCTVVPYMHVLGIEAQSQHCTSLNGGDNSMILLYTSFTFIVYSLLPICGTSVLAFKLFVFIRKNKRSSCAVCMHKVNKNIIVHTISVLFLFMVCTLPSRMYTIIINMMDFTSQDVFTGFQFVAYVLYSLQGTLNPILYSMMAKEWRRNLNSMVKEIILKRTT